MATSAARPSSAGSARSTGAKPRRRSDPVRRRLSLAVVMVLIGSFLPWLFTGLGSVSGARGPGLWSAYAAMLGLAAVFMPWRRVAGVHAAIFAAAAMALPAWQVAHTVSLVGFGGWFPGPGLVVVFGGGVVAAGAALAMLRGPQPDAEGA